MSFLHSVHITDAAYGRAVSADADAPAASQSGPDTLPDSVLHRWEARRNTIRFFILLGISVFELWCMCFLDAVLIIRDLHLVILQTLLSKAAYNWGIHKAINLEEANRQRKCP